MYLYIVKLQDYHKIGITDNFKARLSQLQTASPFKIDPRYVFEFEDATLIEKVLHQKFYPKRSSGEWFLLSDQDIIDIVYICIKLGGECLMHKGIDVFGRDTAFNKWWISKTIIYGSISMLLFIILTAVIK